MMAAIATPGITARDSLVLLATDRRGHLNHRSIWVLKVIGREPGLSNKEVAERVGGLNKGHMSIILARLKGLGLVENTQDDPTPYVANAWKLTGAGEELERAVRHETVGAPESSGAHPVRNRAAPAPVADAEAALLAAFEHALEQASERVRTACAAQEGWLDEVRAGVLALLELFDEQPALARLLVVRSAQAGPLLGARRSEAFAQLVRVLDDERAPARRYPPSLAAEGVASGVLGVLYERLLKRDSGRLADLLGPLMSMIVLPYLGARAARRELMRPAAAPSRRVPAGREAALELLQGTSGRAVKQHLTPRVLKTIAAEPGLSNIEIAQRAGVKDKGHMSRLLARLVRLGLAENRLDAEDARASTNVWHLTRSGEQMEQALRRKAPTAMKAARRPRRAVSETATDVRSVS